MLCAKKAILGWIGAIVCVPVWPRVEKIVGAHLLLDVMDDHSAARVRGLGRG